MFRGSFNNCSTVSQYFTLQASFKNAKVQINSIYSVKIKYLGSTNDICYIQIVSCFKEHELQHKKTICENIGSDQLCSHDMAHITLRKLAHAIYSAFFSCKN